MCYEHKLLTPRFPRKVRRSGQGREWMHKRAKHSDAVMTGILVTKFKMGQIDVKDLAEMVADESKAERCSAAKKVLEAVIDSDHPTCNKP
jgi:hypothetical protein